MRLSGSQAPCLEHGPLGCAALAGAVGRGMSDSLPDPLAEEPDAPLLPEADPKAEPGEAARAPGESGPAGEAAGETREGGDASSAAMPPPVSPLPMLKALADPVRYRLLTELAGGAVLTVAGMARRLQAHPDTIGQHVKVLRRAGTLRRVKSDGADGRVKEFQIPAEYRARPGWLDFPGCSVQVVR